ncbi:uracil-DNA glycosylase [Paenibacillus alkalitolerans]|uniref:uracil-DNA glycosylase n=1 Tax=Paenibacillus alkalitolerans TaxID=2799335 RepID=UPI0018F6EEF7|nr:uracil-DNA glycosylase [Paenibacillus alkalitolerans]
MGLIGNDWDALLASEYDKPYFQQLQRFLAVEYEQAAVFPERRDIFSALRLTPYADTKVVILGQDPYHGPGQAHGLSFSVRYGVGIPRSLTNIFKELKDDVGADIPKHGNLDSWARQGVLLLNTVLTVREGEPNSHKGKGWEIFTDRIIRILNDHETPIVFILWGSHAAAKRELIDESRHHVIVSAHPSPLSARRGFFGSRPFSKTNEMLKSSGLPEIDWTLPVSP